MRKSSTMHPTAQGFVFDFSSEALLKRRKQVVNRIKRGFLKKLAENLNIFNMMAMTLLILGFGVSSAFLLIGAQPCIKSTPLYAEYSTNFNLLHPLF